MRLWTLHPKYLDRAGLAALWREALLAQAVLRGETRGCRNHPQLIRFRNHAEPLETIGVYLTEILCEAVRRGYRFNPAKIGAAEPSRRSPSHGGNFSASGTICSGSSRSAVATPMVFWRKPMNRILIRSSRFTKERGRHGREYPRQRTVLSRPQGSVPGIRRG